MVVSNIGVVPDFSSLYTTNAGPYTATIQVALQDEHRLSSFEYMDRVQKEMAKPISGHPHLLFERLDGGCHSELGNAGSDRRAGERSQPEAVVWRGAGSGQPHPATAGSGRGLHSAGYELSRAAAERRPGACRRTGADAKGSGRQRHHGAQFKCDDCSQLLGRSKERQRLFPDGAIFREWSGRHSQLCRPDQYPDPLSQPEAADDTWMPL